MTPETEIKNEIKDCLNGLGIFWYWILQGKGCKKGLPDLVMHHRGQTVYLEVKSSSGKLSKEQREFRDRCEYDGIPYWVVCSVDGLIKRIGGKIG